MINTRFVLPMLAIASFAAQPSISSAAPLVYINQGQPTECVVTPTAGTVFTLSAVGDVLITGSYTGGNCGAAPPAPSAPSFTPLSPAPANLTIANSSLPSTGGTVTPSFVVYYANSCTGKVTATTGCAAVGGAWGNGTTVCTGSPSTYCSPGTATVAMPANAAQTACTYTFQAINCTNANGSINSQTANVTVAGVVVNGQCTEGESTGDLGTHGYTRQCSGTISSTNTSLHPTWNSTFTNMMSGAWPGGAAQLGFGLRVTVNSLQYGSFKFSTGSTAGGVHFESNSSYGTLGLLSVSTVAGDVLGASSLCHGSTLNISSKAGTAANCKLALNTDYYLNISNANYLDGLNTTCGTTSCMTGWTTYGYGN